MFQTNYLKSRTTPHESPACEFCGAEKQDEYHIFVECPSFQTHRRDSVAKAIGLHSGALAGRDGRATFNANRSLTHRNDLSRPDTDTIVEGFKAYSQSLVYGTIVDKSQYWRGITPPVPPPLTSLESSMAHHLAITLASRIAGAYLRETKRTAAEKAERKRKREGIEEYDGFEEYKEHGE